MKARAANQTSAASRGTPGFALTSVAALLLMRGVALAGPSFPPVPLPPPSGSIVNVSTLSQLRSAVASIASNTTILIDGNTFINCQREVALGLIERTPDDHTGGIVRNNFIYRTIPGDRRSTWPTRRVPRCSTTPS